MGGRPEGTGGEFGWNDYGQQAADEFEPYRPGDQLGAGEQDHHQVAGGGGRRSWQELLGGEDREQVASEQVGDGETAPKPAGGRWWTEDVRRRLRDGERVQATRATGGTFVSHVPKGTPGRVSSTRSGLLGGEYATVQFDNGYAEEVPAADLERGREWWQ